MKQLMMFKTASLKNTGSVYSYCISDWIIRHEFSLQYPSDVYKDKLILFLQEVWYSVIYCSPYHIGNIWLKEMQSIFQTSKEVVDEIKYLIPIQ